MTQNVFEQLTYQYSGLETVNLGINSRLDERRQNNQSGTAYRWREQIGIEGRHGRIRPVVFDELFFNLNHPDWVSAEFFAENRVFVGVILPVNDSQSLRIGYMNQTFLDRRTTIYNNIIYFTYFVRT